MILHLYQGMCEVAIRISKLNVPCGCRLQLVICPIPVPPPSCGGSPWFLHGCWPFHPTDVDIANPHPDYPPMCLWSDGVDHHDCLFHFPVDNKLWDLPVGRHHGMIRIAPEPKFGGATEVKVLSKKVDKMIPPEYLIGKNCNLEREKCPPPPKEPECCVVTEFDIELGPVCPNGEIEKVCEVYPTQMLGEN
jgi:hypothetical protein